MKLFCRLLIMVVSVVIAALFFCMISEESDGANVDVYFEEGIVVRGEDTEGILEDILLTSSPTSVKDTYRIWAVVDEVEYGDVYINGVLIDPYDTEFLVSNYPSGIHFEAFRTDYSIYFMTNGGSGNPINPITGLKNGDSCSIPGISYSLWGRYANVWNTEEDGNGDDISPGDNFSINLDFLRSNYDGVTVNRLDVYPKWIPIEYSISFNNNDGIGDPPSDLSSVTIDSGANIPGVGITKTGYQATIWNTSPNGNGVDISPGQLSLTGPLIESCFGNDTSVILYPKWSEKEYRMLFTAEDVFGTIPDPLLGITINTSINLPGASFSRTGYDMVAWNTRNDSTGDSLQIGDITANASFLEQFFASNTELTLYPVWSAKTYSVSLSTERGTIAEDLWVKNGNSYKHDYTIESETFQMPSVESDDRFYDFICWEDQNGNTVSSIAKGSSGDLALHAVWAPREYTMNININGRMVSQICTLDSVLEDPECEEGFQFVGWFFKDQEGKETEFTSMSQMSEGMSIYAVFEPIKDDPVTMAASAIILVAFFSAVMFFSFRKR